MTIQIIPEEGVPSSKVRGRGRPGDPVLKAQVDKFLRMKPRSSTYVGDSFFVEGAKSRDLEYLRRPIKKAGANIEIVNISRDQIYGTAGVRAWRLAGPYDDEL